MTKEFLAEGLEQMELCVTPSSPDVRSMALFDGAFRLQGGLMVHLDPQRLRPSQLARCRLFGAPKPSSTGEPG